MKDLFVLAADRNMQVVMATLFNKRLNSFFCRNFESDVVYLPQNHDAGFPDKFVDVIRAKSKEYHFALACLDREGSRFEHLTSIEMERLLEEKLSASGWKGRAAAIVFDPELEVWVWSDSPHVERILGWCDRIPDLRSWLMEKSFLKKRYDKPIRPKEAMQSALRQVHIVFSSAIHQELAEHVSLKNCQDPAFLKLKRTLQSWFPIPA